MEFSGFGKLKVKVTPERSTNDDGEIIVEWKAVLTLEVPAVSVDALSRLGLFQGQDVEFCITSQQGVLGEEQGEPMLDGLRMVGQGRNGG